MWKLDKGANPSSRGEVRRSQTTVGQLWSHVYISKITGHPKITEPWPGEPHLLWKLKVWSRLLEIQSHSIWNNNVLIYSSWRAMLFRCQRVLRKTYGGLNLVSFGKSMHLLRLQEISHCCPLTPLHIPLLSVLGTNVLRPSVWLICNMSRLSWVDSRQRVTKSNVIKPL